MANTTVTTKCYCRSSHQKCSIKKEFLKISQNSQESTCARPACNFIKKETLAQVLSCEFRETFKNTFLIGHHHSLKKNMVKKLKAFNY